MTDAFNQFWEARVESTPDAAFFVYGDRTSTSTYAGFDASMNRLAHGLAGEGVRVGDKVALLLPSDLALLRIELALQRLGAVMVPMIATLTRPEIMYVLGHCRPSRLITDAKGWRTIADGGDVAVDHPLEVYAWGAELDGARDGRTLESDREDRPAAPDIGALDAMAIMYTSGSTGRPKGVVQPSGGFAAAGWAIADRLGADAGDNFLSALPLFHTAATHMILAPAIAAGVRFTLIPRFRRDRFWSQVRASGATISLLMPAQLSILMTAQPRPGDRDHSLAPVGVEGPALHPPPVRGPAEARERQDESPGDQGGGPAAPSVGPDLGRRGNGVVTRLSASLIFENTSIAEHVELARARGRGLRAGLARRGVARAGRPARRAGDWHRAHRPRHRDLADLPCQPPHRRPAGGAIAGARVRALRARPRGGRRFRRRALVRRAVRASAPARAGVHRDRARRPVVARAWPFSYEGELLRTREYQLPFADHAVEVPIHLGAIGPKMQELAGELANGIIVGALHSEASMHETRARLAKGAARVGRDVDERDVWIYLTCLVSRDDERARRLARRSLVYLAQYPHNLKVYEQEGFGPVTAQIASLVRNRRMDEAEAAVTDQMVERFAVAGTPEECRQQLARFERYFAVPVLHMVPFRIDEEPVRESVRLASELLSGTRRDTVSIGR